MPNAILFDILNAVQTGIAGRGLTGISASNVLVQKAPGNRASDLPAQQFPTIVIASCGSEGLDPAAGTTSRDDVVYRVLVAILAADNSDQQANFNQYLTWRQSIRQLFHDQPLAGLCFRVQVEPLEIVDRDAWFQRNVFASGLVLHCFSREPRG
jgi:hypothetical protein